MCTRCFETQTSPGCTCTQRSQFLTHSLINKCQINIKMPALFMKKIKSDKITAFSFLRQCICLSDRIVRIFFAVFRRTAKNLSDMHDLYLTWTLESIQDFDLMLYKKYSFFITLNKIVNRAAHFQKIMHFDVLPLYEDSA